MGATMKVFACVLLAVAAQAAPEADPALLYGAYPYAAGVYGAYPYAAHVVPAASVVTGNSVPVAVGGYKAVAGSNGDLAGPVHEVPGLVPALAVQKQESEGAVSLSTGTGALVHTPVVTYYGKREADADPALVYAGFPHAGVYGYGYPYAHVAPLSYAVKPLQLKTETTEILPELFMRFPDFSQLPLSSSRKTPTEVPSLSEPAPLSPTLLSRERLKPIPTFFTELPTTHTLSDTLPMDTLPMDGLTMDRHLESGV